MYWPLKSEYLLNVDIVDYGGDRKADGIVDWLKKEVAKH